MELRILEICKAKGLKLSDLANRMGTDPSNLNAALRGNPTLGKLQSIADALGVNVYDLFKKPEEESIGSLTLNGQVFRISKPPVSMVQVPAFNQFDELRAKVKNFVNRCIDKKIDDAICGMVETLEFFTLSYDKGASSFSLSICYGNGRVLSFRYSIDDYSIWVGDNQKWDEHDVIDDIQGELEGAVLFKFQLEPNQA